MTWQVLVRPEAEHDLLAARDWYDEKQFELGDCFLDAAADAIREIAENPIRNPLYFGNFRRTLLRRFPYKVFYQVIDQRIIVFRILHAKQCHERGLGTA